MTARRWDLVAFLVGLQLADVLTTWQGLAGGGHHEGNPVGVFLLGLGVPGLVMGKAVATGFVAGVSEWTARQGELGRQWAVRGLRLACWLMLAVVAWNAVRVSM